MDFHILGPLEVLNEGAPVEVSGAKQRALLALLLVHANETVTTDRLVDDIWGESPPGSASHAVEVYNMVSADCAQFRFGVRDDGRVSAGPARDSQSVEQHVGCDRLAGRVIQEYIGSGGREASGCIGSTGITECHRAWTADLRP